MYNRIDIQKIIQINAFKIDMFCFDRWNGYFDGEVKLSGDHLDLNYYCIILAIGIEFLHLDGLI